MFLNERHTGHMVEILDLGDLIDLFNERDVSQPAMGTFFYQ